MGIVARRSAHLTAVSQRRRALVVRRALSACAWLLRNTHGRRDALERAGD
jgi:hypothetical protein